jgi:Flp pilus assembly protein protease CpaA
VSYLAELIGWTPLWMWAVVMAASLIAAVTDLRTRRIANGLTLPLLAFGLGAALLRGGLPGLGLAIAGMCLLALPYLMLFVTAGGGGGDVKLMAAIGACVGLFDGAIVLFSVALVGVLLAVIVGLWMQTNGTHAVTAIDRHNSLNVPGVDDVDADPRSVTIRNVAIPYGVAIFVGVISTGLGVLVWTH